MFTYALYRTGAQRRTRHDVAVDFWLLFVFLLGPLSYLRFDMLPAVLAGGALLAARRRPWVTGALTGLGAAVKLWPALLIAAFCAHRPDRKAAGWAFVAVGFGLAGISLLTGGLDPAGVPVDLAVGPRAADRVHLGHPADAGPGLSAERLAGRHLPLPGVRDLRARRRGLVADQQRGDRARPGDPGRCSGSGPTGLPRSPRWRSGLIVLATVAIMTVTNKTLSPQYLLWLGGPMAALLLLRPAADRRTGRPSTAWPSSCCCWPCSPSWSTPCSTTGCSASGAPARSSLPPW